MCKSEQTPLKELKSHTKKSTDKIFCATVESHNRITQSLN